MRRRYFSCLPAWLPRALRPYPVSRSVHWLRGMEQVLTGTTSRHCRDLRVGPTGRDITFKTEPMGNSLSVRLRERAVLVTWSRFARHSRTITDAPRTGAQRTSLRDGTPAQWARHKLYFHGKAVPDSLMVARPDTLRSTATRNRMTLLSVAAGYTPIHREL